jgi:exonuclease VII large subunit
MDRKSRQLKDEIYAEMKMHIDNMRITFKKELKNLDNENKKSFENLTNKVQTEMTQAMELQKKYALETDKTLIDYQKQILQDKLILEDTARRVYLLESIVSAKAPVVPQFKGGYVTFVDGNRISISLGGVNEVKVGDYLGIYKDTKKIGTIQIDTVAMNSSKGVVINIKKGKTINIGDKIEIEEGTSK